jgi:hypothetical protein
VKGGQATGASYRERGATRGGAAGGGRPVEGAVARLSEASDGGAGLVIETMAHASGPTVKNRCSFGCTTGDQ